MQVAPDRPAGPRAACAVHIGSAAGGGGSKGLWLLAGARTAGAAQACAVRYLAQLRRLALGGYQPVLLGRERAPRVPQPVGRCQHRWWTPPGAASPRHTMQVVLRAVTL